MNIVSQNQNHRLTNLIQSFIVRPTGSHRPPSDKAGRPRGLKIESACDAIDIQQLTREKQPWTDLAFHRLELDLAELHATACDKFIPVQTLAADVKFRA